MAKHILVSNPNGHHRPFKPPHRCSLRLTGRGFKSQRTSQAFQTMKNKSTMTRSPLFQIPTDITGLSNNVNGSLFPLVREVSNPNGHHRPFKLPRGHRSARLDSKFQIPTDITGLSNLVVKPASPSGFAFQIPTDITGLSNSCPRSVAQEAA